MKLGSLECLISQINNIKKELDITEGDSFSWSYKFENGNTSTYVINGVREPEKIERDIAQLLVWAWSLKDYIKTALHKKGSKLNIDALVNKEQKVCLCADLANLIKHGHLNNSRSNQFPSFKRPFYKFPDDSLSKLTFTSNTVNISINDSSLALITMPVINSKGEQIGDAIDIAKHTIPFWEHLISNEKLHI